MFQFLVVGSLGAVGAAMALGTLAALIRYHRTGEWPGREGAVDITTGRLVVLWLRVIVGAVIAIYAYASLSSSGQL